MLWDGGRLAGPKLLQGVHVVSQINLGAHQDDWDVGTVVSQFGDPFVADILEGGGGHYWEANDENVLQINDNTSPAKLVTHMTPMYFGAAACFCFDGRTPRVKIMTIYSAGGLVGQQVQRIKSDPRQVSAFIIGSLYLTWQCRSTTLFSEIPHLCTYTALHTQGRTDRHHQI